MHPPSTKIRYLAPLYNVEELKQHVQETIIVPGMDDMQIQDK